MRQSLELFRRVIDHINKWRGVKIRLGNESYSFTATLSETKTGVEFQNRSRVVSLPNNPDAIRGYRADYVYVDEAAMFRNDFEVKAAVIPCIAGRQGRLSLISTPKGRRGWFYEAWNSDIFSKHRVHYSDSPHLTRDDIEGMRATLSPLEWEQEMELQFLDEVNALFPYELILQCVSDYEVRLEKPENPAYIGIDFGRYRDSTVITVVEKLEDNTLKIIFIDELLRKDFNEQIKHIERLINFYGPAGVAIDKTGMGIPLHDLLVKKFPHVDGVTLTANTKEAIIKALHSAMNNRKIVIPADATQLINQLRTFQRVQTRTTVRYEAPQGQHDDYVTSLALATYSAIKQPSRDVKIHTGFWKT